MSAARVVELSSNPEQLDMTRYQLLLLPAVAAAIVILGGGLHSRALGGKHLPVLAAAGSATDPEALALLDQALAALAPERVQWLEATVWQQARCDDFTYRACGRLLTAPGDRARLDVNVMVGKTQGELRIVCDGQNLHRSIRVGGDAATVTRVALPVLKDGFKTPEELTRARAQFAQEQGMAGLEPLLRGLRQGLQHAQFQHQDWKGTDVLAVTGTWPEDADQAAALPDIFKPRFQPRLCRIYLDARTFWPHRLEWWGSEKPSEPNTLLVETEFRDAVLNRTLSAEQCAAQFAVPP
jgi:hypothetical protein